MISALVWPESIQGIYNPLATEITRYRRSPRETYILRVDFVYIQTITFTYKPNVFYTIIEGTFKYEQYNYLEEKTR